MLSLLRVMSYSRAWAYIGPPKKCSSRNERVYKGSEEKLNKTKLTFLVRMGWDESQRDNQRLCLFRVISRTQRHLAGLVLVP